CSRRNRPGDSRRVNESSAPWTIQSRSRKSGSGCTTPPTSGIRETSDPMPDASAQPLLDPAFLTRLEQLELVSRKIFLGRMTGEPRSKRKGQSVEFADSRNYVVGDDLRFLDWNLYARLDKLFLRLFMEEEDLHFYILLDNSLSMDFGSPTKLH